MDKSSVPLCSSGATAFLLFVFLPRAHLSALGGWPPVLELALALYVEQTLALLERSLASWFLCDLMDCITRPGWRYK